MGNHRRIYPAETRVRLPYRDRIEAGRILAGELSGYSGRPGLLVLGLPRGGVAVAYEIAGALGTEMDLMIVRKLGVPGREELAMGAIASGGVQVMNPEVVQGIPEHVIGRMVDLELKELRRREEAYRGSRPALRIKGRPVILVDDGLATGATMKAAVTAARSQDPSELVVAVPVAPPDTVERLGKLADDVVCPARPEPFFAIGQWYEDFSQMTDAEVGSLLRRAWGEYDA